MNIKKYLSCHHLDNFFWRNRRNFKCCIRVCHRSLSFYVDTLTLDPVVVVVTFLEEILTFINLQVTGGSCSTNKKDSLQYLRLYNYLSYIYDKTYSEVLIYIIPLLTFTINLTSLRIQSPPWSNRNWGFGKYSNPILRNVGGNLIYLRIYQQILRASTLIQTLLFVE